MSQLIVNSILYPLRFRNALFLKLPGISTKAAKFFARELRAVQWPLDKSLPVGALIGRAQQREAVMEVRERQG